LKTVAQNRDDYDIPLKVLSYKELYGWTMDSIVAEVKHIQLLYYIKNFISVFLTRYVIYFRLAVKIIAHFAVFFEDKHWTEVLHFWE